MMTTLYMEARGEHRSSEMTRKLRKLHIGGKADIKRNDRRKVGRSQRERRGEKGKRKGNKEVDN
jgi:hypothetical protein